MYDYPIMPPGTCRESSWVLAACYPELEYVEGVRTMVIHVTDGRIIRDSIEHAWNVNRMGVIVDSTLVPRMRREAESHRVLFEYTPTAQSTWSFSMQSDADNDFASAARSQVTGKLLDERRLIVEAFGRMFLSDQS